MLKTTTVVFICAPFFLAMPALAAESYTVDKAAWLCRGASVEAIQEVEAHTPKRGTIAGDDDLDNCEKAATPRGVLTGENMFNPPGSDDVNKPVTVMYAKGRLAFVCSQYVGCDNGVPYEAPVFDCRYALVADMRDSHNKPVTLEQLQKEAQHNTMSSIPNTCALCGCHK